MLKTIEKIYEYIRGGYVCCYLGFICRKIFITNDIAWKIRQHVYLYSILKYASKHCGHYRDLGFVIRKWSDVKRYPLLSKGDIKSNPQSFLTDNLKKELFSAGYTGGSTGEPLKLYKSPGYDACFQKKLWIKNGYKRGDIILTLDGASVDEKDISKGKYLYKKNKTQLPYGGWGLSSLYLTDKNIGEYCKALVDLKPSFIRGYPSFVYRIAQYMHNNCISIDFNIKGIELTSEMSYGFQHELIAEVFSTHIFLQYGHTEELVFGYTFDDSLRYRVEPLYGYVEIIKSNGEHAQIGEDGEIVVTSLHNRVMPLIRYRTGDRAIFGGEDKHGVILTNLEGRTQDYIINMDGEKVLLTALIFAQHFDALGNIDRWQLEQYKPGMVVMHIIKGTGYSKKDEEEIFELFMQKGNVQTTFDYVGEISITKRGKSLLLVQHLDVD